MPNNTIHIGGSRSCQNLDQEEPIKKNFARKIWESIILSVAVVVIFIILAMVGLIEMVLFLENPILMLLLAGVFFMLTLIGVEA